MATRSDDLPGENPENWKPLYVFEAPVRVWHWTHAFSITVLAISGYFIANPLPSLGGEASNHFLMGTIRMTHFIAAYVFIVGFLVRLYWAAVGNHYSRELFYLPLWSGDWWRRFGHEIRFYAFLTDKMPKTPAHNPLAQTAMWLFNVVLAVFMICTGLALYSQGLGDGSWADILFGWVFVISPSSQAVRMWHLMGMWLMVVFIIIHLYMVIRADIIGRQSSISTMIGGWRTYKDDYPGDPPR